MLKIFTNSQHYGFLGSGGHFGPTKRKEKGKGNRKEKMRRFTRASSSELTARDVVDEDLIKCCSVLFYRISNLQDHEAAPSTKSTKTDSDISTRFAPWTPTSSLSCEHLVDSETGVSRLRDREYGTVFPRNCDSLTLNTSN